MNIYLLKNNMTGEQIKDAIASYTKVLEATQKTLKELENMIPDEDKPVVTCWYSVYHNDWVLYVDQRLDAHTEQEAYELVADNKLRNIQSAAPHNYKVMVFEAPIRMEVKQSSYPF